MRTSPAGRLHGMAPRQVVPVQLSSLPPRLARRLDDAVITSEHLVAFGIWLALGPLVVAIGSALGGYLVATAAAVLVLLTPPAFVGARQGRRRQLVGEALPSGVDMMARALRSGASLRNAVVSVVHEGAPALAQELSPMVRSLERGQLPADALHRWAETSAVHEVRLVAAALSFAVEHESASTQALDGVSQSLRDRHILAAEVRALSSQAAASMQMLVLLPVGFLLLDALASRRVLSFLVHEPVGQFCATVGLLLNIIGLIWMRVLVQRRLVR